MNKSSIAHHVPTVNWHLSCTVI